MTTAAPATGTTTAARVVDAVKVHGTGDTEVRALDGVSVGFPAGRFTAIMGPSGSCKSTLMHCAAGLDTLTSGTAFIGGTDLGALDDRRLTLLRLRRVGFVFGSPRPSTGCPTWPPLSAWARASRRSTAPDAPSPSPTPPHSPRSSTSARSTDR